MQFIFIFMPLPSKNVNPVFPPSSIQSSIEGIYHLLKNIVKNINSFTVPDHELGGRGVQNIKIF